MTEMHKIVTIYCASSSHLAPVYIAAAKALAKALVEQGVHIVTGGGRTGLMGAVADETLACGGHITGIIPRFMVERGWHHSGLSEMRLVETMHERKRMMADLSDGVSALPGGCGTLEELLEIITWKQLGLYLNPIIILNINGFYNPLLEMLQRAVEGNFMRKEHVAIWKVASTAEEAINLLYTTPVWNKEIRKFAAI